MKRSAAYILAIALLATVSGPHPAAAAPFSLSSDEFPIIMFAADSHTTCMKDLADMGVTYVHTYGMGRSTDSAALRKGRRYLDDARDNKLKVLVNLRGRCWLTRTNGVEQMRTYVREFKNHPALGFWYLIDEPSAVDATAAQLLPYYRMLKEETPDVPVAVLHAWSTNWWKYGHVQDILMNDYYSVKTQPFPKAPIDATMKFTANALAHDDPVIPLLQCYNMKHYYRDRAKLRYPNRVELRYWSYACISMGTRGLSWWAYANSLSVDGGKWMSHTFGPMISNVRTFVDAVTPTRGRDMLMDGKGSDKCFLAVWKHRNTAWVVLVNNRNTARTVTLSMKNTIANADLVPCKGTRDVNARIRFRKLESISLEPWETFVWKAVPPGTR